ncbi:CPBP family intramembrane glutamic endopeptidase [Pseudomonas beijingensis]|uniref:CPBP family intramembrane glutamic endopeptidase n=1 Tax=Pseudomonas beijingensis TaxID=2954101 RepID=UPI0027350439|nr:type II CAAX endopeptidase family protein [Pseudomonas sp. FP2262]WLH48647.1 type II CAAX endopeptidase family protein [Pseudomonas sp. FP2262]
MTNLSAAPEFAPASTLSPYRFFPRLGMFVLATLIVFLAAMPEVLFVPADMQAYLTFTTTSGITALVLLALFALQYRADSRTQWRGHAIRKPLQWGAIGIIGTYLLFGVAVFVLGLPREVFMAELLDGLNSWQVAIKIASLIVLPPIAEELFFRHYMLRLFPYENSRAWTWIAIIVTSAIFAGMHIQYGNWITVVLIFACGGVFAVARVVSGGLLVPVLLHSLAEVVALTTDKSFSLMGLYG